VGFACSVGSVVLTCSVGCFALQDEKIPEANNTNRENDIFILFIAVVLFWG
jgi:hypothetical protein